MWARPGDRRDHRVGGLSISGSGKLGPRGERPLATTWPARRRNGEAFVITFDRPSLVVAVKSDCDGCRFFYAGDLAVLAPWRVVLVTRDDVRPGEYEEAVHDVLVAPALLDALDVRWPPFYVVVDVAPVRATYEGVAFTPEQVASELASQRR